MPTDPDRANPAVPPLAAPSAEHTTAEATLPGTNVSAGAWTQFQQRMQMRREATCVAAMRRAMDAGDYRGALERAKELAAIDATWNDVERFLEDVVSGAAKRAAAPALPAPLPAAVAMEPAPPAAEIAKPRIERSLAPASRTLSSASAAATQVIAPPASPPQPRVDGARPVRVLRAFVALLVLLALAAAAFAGWTVAGQVPMSRVAGWMAATGERIADAVLPSPVSAPVKPAPRPELLPPLPPADDLQTAPPLPRAGDLEPAPPLPPPAETAEHAVSQKRKGHEEAGAHAETHVDRPTSSPGAHTNTSVPQQPPAPATRAPSGGAPPSPIPSSRTTGSGPPATATGSDTIAAGSGTTATGSPVSGTTRPEVPPAALTPVSPPPTELALPSSPVAETKPETSVPAIGSGTPPDSRATAGVAEREADERAINRTLGAYAQGYTTLNAAAVKRVWPTVNEEALGNAFAQLASQRVAFSECAVDVRGLHASASCRGTARYVPRAGSRDPLEMSRVWQFSLRKRIDTWVIDSVR